MTRGETRVWQADRGSLLLWTLGVNLLLFLYLVGSFPFFHTVVSVPARSYLDTQGLFLAESGIARGLWEFNDNGADFACTTDPIPGPWVCDDPTCAAVGGGGTDCRTLTISGFPAADGSGPAGDLEVVAMLTDTDISSPPGEPAGAWARLYATGFYPNATNPTVTRKIRADLQWVSRDFRYAAFGHDRLLATGKVAIDSYSSETLFGDPWAYGPGNSGGQGDVGTNGAGTANPDAHIETDDGYVLNGNLHLADNSSFYVGAGDLAGVVMTQRAQDMPTVVIPSSLSSLPVTTANKTGWSGFDSAANGDSYCPGTCVCSTAVRVKSLKVDGTLNMDAGCQILVDRCAGGTCSSAPYSGSGVAVDTDGSGKFLKRNSTETTQIFIRDGNFNFDGGGVQWASSIAASDRQPERLQLYVTQASGDSGIAMRPHTGTGGSPFYGVIYVEGGVLKIAMGSENGGLYDTEYFGAFESNRLVHVDTSTSNKEVLIHYDRALQGLKLDGTGRDVAAGEGVVKINGWYILE